MEYVVTAWGENDKLIRKTFKYRKSAEKFGVKMVEKYNQSYLHSKLGYISPAYCPIRIYRRDKSVVSNQVKSYNFQGRKNSRHAPSFLLN